MRLSVIRRLFDSDQHFARGMLGLLDNGDVRLLDSSRAEVPNWRWRTLFVDGDTNTVADYSLEITRPGIAKVT